MDVRDLMVEKVITVGPDTKVGDAVELMNENEIGCLVIERDGRPLGIITERDVLKKIVCQSKKPKQVRVSEIMSQPLIVGNADMDLGEAVKIMLKWNIKKLPIVNGDGGKLAGLITFSDIVKADHIERLLFDTIKQLRQSGWIPPKHMNRTIGLYIT
jgi:CBS domain-containing protein